MHRIAMRRSAPPHRQRGATAVLMGIALVATTTAAMLAIEVGRIYATHRQLQNYAQTAALDAVRIVGGCDRRQAPTQDEIDAGVRASLVRQGADPDLLLDGGTITPGALYPQGGLRHLGASSADEAIAVGVELGQAFPAPFFGLLPSTTGRRMYAQGEAAQEVIGAVSIGTGLVSVDSTRSALLDAMLGAQLGGAVSLDVLSYEGLLRSRVTLDQLAAAAGVATPGDLLALDLEVPEALALVADALEAQGEGVEAAAVDALRELAAIVDPDRNATRFGDLVAVEDGTEDLAGNLPINALELTQALAEAAAKGYMITLPLALGVPGLGTVDLTLVIGEARQLAIGRPGFLEDGTPRTQARSAQVRLQLDFDVPLPLLDAVAPGTLPPLGLSLAGEIASGTATLEEVRCARSGRPSHETTVDAVSALATLAVGRHSNIDGANSPVVPLGNLVNVAGLLGIAVTSVVDLGSVGGGHHEEDFAGPFVPRIDAVDPSHVREIGAGVGATVDGLVADVAAGLVPALQVTTPGLVNPLRLLGTAAVTNLIVNDLDVLWDGLDAALGEALAVAGLQVGSATVTMESLEARPPRLFVKN